MKGRTSTNRRGAASSAPPKLADIAATQWSAIPARAASDARLRGRHFRLLAAVAFHDRFGKNGTHCYAGAGKLAGETGIHKTDIARLMGDLEEWGYIDIGIHPLNKRLRIYAVRYDPDGRKKVGVGTNQLDGDSWCPDQPSAEIVGATASQPTDFNEETDINILPEGYSNKSCETEDLSDFSEKENSAEAISQGDREKRKSEIHSIAAGLIDRPSPTHHVQDYVFRDGLGSDSYTLALLNLSEPDWETARMREHVNAGAGVSYLRRRLTDSGLTQDSQNIDERYW